MTMSDPSVLKIEPGVPQRKPKRDAFHTREPPAKVFGKQLNIGSHIVIPVVISPEARPGRLHRTLRGSLDATAADFCRAQILFRLTP